ncbi:Membrane-associated lipoprotein [Mesomycoplasma hyopneumoniae]|uniref:Membrane-associated lipoprotein n=1 Tax=Mesomycoplasma hyopneumoniae TaxID=2099 RepID=A0A223M959_MESHO|nr:Membrane-associated lipoprotein [Mesomycoplasma hyopneumoniae]
MNSESSFYNNLASDENNPESKSQDNANKGNYFSLNIGYRSFADKPGLADGFITVPKVGKELSKSTIMADPVHKKQVKKEVIENGKKIIKDLGELDVLNQKAYLGYGLYYIPRHFAPHGGPQDRLFGIKIMNLSVFILFQIRRQKQGLRSLLDRKDLTIRVYMENIIFPNMI